jgi:hypothetical protein
MFKNVQFFAFAFKVCKKCYNDLKNCFVKNINMVTKNAPKKLKAKTMKKCEKTSYSNVHSFLGIAFYKGISQH